MGLAANSNLEIEETMITVKAKQDVSSGMKSLSVKREKTVIYQQISRNSWKRLENLLKLDKVEAVREGNMLVKTVKL